MPEFTYVSEKEAPLVPKAMSKSAHATLKILQGLKDGHVARVVPDPEGSTLRGLKASFSRVANGQGVKVVAYESADDPGVLFVKKVK